MTTKVSEPVSVILGFNHESKKVAPKIVGWKGRNHKVEKVGLSHTYRRGNTLFHVFSVVTSTIFMRLELNTSNLHWRLEEIADGPSV